MDALNIENHWNYTDDLDSTKVQPTDILYQLSQSIINYDDFLAKENWYGFWYWMCEIVFSYRCSKKTTTMMSTHKKKTLLDRLLNAAHILKCKYMMIDCMATHRLDIVCNTKKKRSNTDLGERK